MTGARTSTQYWNRSAVTTNGELIVIDNTGYVSSITAGGPVFSPTSQSLYLPGLSGNYMSTPDTGAVSITGDIDIRCKVALDDWTPGAAMALVAKYDTAGSQRAWRLLVATNGRPNFAFSTDGTTPVTVTPGSWPSYTDGSTIWLRVARVAATGVITMYDSVDGTTWTQQLQTTQATGSIFDSSALLTIGAWAVSGSAEPLAGNVYYAEVRSGIDGPVVAKFDPALVSIAGARLPTTHTQPARAEAIRLPGVAGNYISQPDSALNSVTGDIDIRWQGSLDDWTPAASTLLLSKTNTNQLSYQMYISTAGTLNFNLSSNGTSYDLVNNGTAGLGFTDGTTWWLRATYVSATGAFVMYKSSDGVTWTSVGSGTGTPGAIFDSTSALQIGSNFLGSNVMAGSVVSAEVRSGIGGPAVASFNAGNVIATGAKTPATVDLWTISGSAWSWDTAITEPSSGALRLPGVAGNYVSTPDAADISIVGDIDLRAKVALDSWLTAGTQRLISKSNTTGNQQSYRLAVNSSGYLSLALSADGTTVVSATSGVATGLAAGATKWVRATWALVGGLANFYTSDDGVSWTLLGAANQSLVSVGTFDSTAVLELGSTNSGATEPLAGYIYRAEVYAGIAGTLVAAFDAQNAPATTNRLPTTVTGATGKVWTLNGSLWEWVNQPAPTPWTVNGSAWHWVAQ